jgi:hypothetical protein
MRLSAMGVLIGTSALAQPRGGQETAPPPASFSATSIPGGVAAGAKIELVKAGRGRTEGPAAAGRKHAGEQREQHSQSRSLSGNVTTFIENSNQTNAMGWDLLGVSSR